MNEPAKPPAEREDQSPSLDDVIGAMERLMRLFQMERILYLVFGFASLVLFVYAAYRVFSSGDFTSTDMNIVLGATGISAACSSRVVYFLNKAFGIIESIVMKKISEGDEDGR